MQPIITNSTAPSNDRGARIKATLFNNFTNKSESIHIAFDDADSARTNHATAAMELLRKLDALGNPDAVWQCGEMPDGRYCFVMSGEGFTQYFNIYQSGAL